MAKLVRANFGSFSLDMQISEQAIDELIRLYSKEYGVQLAREQAMEYGVKLIDLVKTVYDGNTPSLIDARKRSGYDSNGDNRLR